MQAWSVVTGASRGIGLEWVRQLAQRGEKVVAAARAPQHSAGLQALVKEHGVLPMTLDVTDPDSIAAFAGLLGSKPVRLLINNAGIGSRGGLEETSHAKAMEVFATNAVGPMLLTAVLLSNLKASGQPKVVNITSTMGSMGDGPSGGYDAYRMSKAALNMFTANLAADHGKDLVTVALCPGWVQTDMGGAGASITAEQSVTGMLAVVDGLNAQMNGRFYNHRGEAVPY